MEGSKRAKANSLQFGEHQVEVTWDPKDDSFDFRVLLSHGEEARLQFIPSTIQKRKIQKRKEKDEIIAAPQPKKRRIEREEADNTQSLGTLPVELLYIILKEASDSSEGVMAIVCKSVCKTWRDVLLRYVFPRNDAIRSLLAMPALFSQNVASFGWLPILKWARGLGCGWDEWMITAAAREGNLEMLKWARAQGCPWHWKRLNVVAAREGHMEVLKWARENGKSALLHWKATKVAASRGHLEVLKWLRAKGCPYHKKGFQEAAKQGHLKLLKWIHKSGGIDSDKGVCYGAARGGHLNILKWARKIGCHWGELTGVKAAKGGHLEVLKWAAEKGCELRAPVCAAAARAGHLEVLKWLRDNGVRGKVETCNAAARGGHLEVLKWLRGYRGDTLTCAAAAKGGHLEVLKWLREHGCPWDRATTCEAAEEGHLDVLEWAVNANCTWDSGMFTLAARKGHINILQWGMKTLGQKKLFDESECCVEAARGGHLELVKWLVEECGAAWRLDYLKRTLKAPTPEVLQWALKHKPWPKRKPKNLLP